MNLSGRSQICRPSNCEMESPTLQRMGGGGRPPRSPASGEREQCNGVDATQLHRAHRRHTINSGEVTNSLTSLTPRLDPTPSVQQQRETTDAPSVPLVCLSPRPIARSLPLRASFSSTLSVLLSTELRGVFVVISTATIHCCLHTSRLLAAGNLVH